MFWRRKLHDPAPTPEERTHELLSAYLDGELSASEQAEVEALIARDPMARAEFDGLSMMLNALEDLGVEVRAPRSFAIAAPAGAMPTAPLALFQRVEVLFRASAAVAALLFVVVLVGNPAGETPVATQTSATESSAAMAETSSLTAEAPADEAAQAAGAARSADGAAPAPSSALAPDSPPDPTAGGIGGGLPIPADESSSNGPDGSEAAAGEAGASASTFGEPEPLAPPSSTVGPDDATDTADDPSSSVDDSATDAGATAELMPGTFPQPASSDGVGGMAAGLGTTAGLLTALSVLLAWNRRNTTTTSSSDR
ncbi:MAG: zf-HC2 domain-containing protein [Chloroflexi bacterium]|nr:zf-HC2 domain-containing protein [Chloroflexota bacterium]